MRKILFRGKRFDNGEWCYGDLINEPWGLVIQFLIEETRRCKVKIDPATVGQYTGLRDKNRRLIFEGDVVQTSKYGLENRKGQNYSGKDKFLVGFEDGTYFLQNHFRRFCLRPDKDIEVIGNIHYSPELLREVQT